MRAPDRIAFVLAFALCAGLGMHARADDAPKSADPSAISNSVLPADADRALVIRTCAVCHPAELLASKKRTPETWDKLINKMIDYGARADDAQQQRILDYFVRHFEGTDTSIGVPVATPPGATAPGTAPAGG